LIRQQAGGLRVDPNTFRGLYILRRNNGKPYILFHYCPVNAAYGF
jgi:hypothetical protein